MSHQPPPPPPPDLGDRYRDLEPLGAGATGAVYAAWDTLMSEPVAIKWVQTPTPASIQRLKQEFRRLRALSHPNLIPLRELVIAGDRAYLTMDRVDGAPLDVSLRAGLPSGTPLPPRAWDACKRALLQAAEGLLAAHDAGVLHRDVKPANVLQRADGRVVVLDFDLSLAARDVWLDPDPGFAGTPLYLAPEALQGEYTEASDVYALGSTLYELLAGRPPFDEAEAVHRKLLGPPAARLVETLGASDLNDLADRMIHADPSARHSLWQVIQTLRASLGLAPLPPAPPAVGFVGREGPLGQLRGGDRSGKPLLVIRGQTGIGKSSLAQRFLRELAASGARCVRSRCHPNETVPYRAFDAFLHAPAPALRCTHGQPPAQVVPALVEERNAAWAASAEALAHTAGDRPLWVWIDDAHWADADSLELLAALVRAPPRHVRFLITCRADQAAFSAWLQQLPSAFLLDLQPMDDHELARLGRGHASAAQVHAAAVRSGGHPQFFLELLRADAADDLDALIRRRTSALESDAARLLTVACVAARPIPTEDLLALAEVPTTRRALTRALIDQQLLTVVESEAGQALAPHHDRIVAAHLQALAPDTRAAWHGRLADWCGRDPQTDPEVMLHHLLGAGRDDEAAPFARQAVHRAEARFAYRRAAELHALILERDWTPTPALTRAQLADAAAMIGDAAQAIAQYAWLAERASEASARLTWSAQATTQELRRGELEAGLAQLRALLRQLGVHVPAARWWATLQSIAYRLALAARGLDLPPAGEVTDLDRIRLSLLWVSAVTLAHQDPPIGDALGARFAWDAVRTGDRRRAAVALAFKAGADAILMGRRGRAAASPLFARARDLADGGPAELAYINACEVPTRWAEGRWRECEAGVERFQAEQHHLRPIVPVDPATMLPYRDASRVHQGKLAALGDLPAAFAEARATHNPHAQRTALLGWPTVAWLVVDRADDAAAALAAVTAELPSDRFLTQHYHQLISEALLHLYRGDPGAALAALDRRWSAFTWSGILGIEVIASEMWFLRGRVVRAAIRAGDTRARPAELARCAAKVAATDMPWTPALVALLRADDRTLANAANAADAHELPHLAAAARASLGDPAGVAWFRDVGARDPVALARAFG